MHAKVISFALDSEPLTASQSAAPSAHSIEIDDYRDLVKSVALGIFFNIRRAVDLDDLISIGTIGLIQAASRFEPERGTPFRIFARFHIRGRILDGLGNTAPLPRKTWRRLCQHNQQESIVIEALPFFDSREELADSNSLDELTYALDATRLPSALATLPRRSAYLLALVYYNGLSLTRAAHCLGISPAQASRDQQHALSRLRRHFDIPAND